MKDSVLTCYRMVIMRVQTKLSLAPREESAAEVAEAEADTARAAGATTRDCSMLLQVRVMVKLVGE